MISRYRGFLGWSFRARTKLVLGLALSVAALCLFPIPVHSQPQTIVAVNLRTPDFVVYEQKYRVFYMTGQRKFIPIADYDFWAALTDELVDVLSEDARAAWRAPSAEETGYLASYFADKKGQGSLPESVPADRLLLVDVGEYGAMVSSHPLVKDQFLVAARVRLVDRVTGRKVWEKTIREGLNLPGKLPELQADNQKGLKQAINKLLEEFCIRIRTKLKEAKI